MFKCINFILISVIFLTIMSGELHSKNKKIIKKTIKYKSHTQIDFGDQVVEGKIKTPEIFYIFQRKRSPGHEALTTPEVFNQHREETYTKLIEGIR